MKDVADVVLLGQQRLGEGGFLELRRLRLCNARADGSRSAEYTVDFVERPKGQDAVVVVAWRRREEPEVLVRQCLRPPAFFGRDAKRAPMPEHPSFFLTELVAGIIERGDIGEPGLRERAAAELHEEAGFRIPPSAFAMLGAPVFPSAGVIGERHYFLRCELMPNEPQHAAPGDGSPLEDGGVLSWLTIREAMVALDRGDIVDGKTEIGIRRLVAHLSRDLNCC